MLFKGKQLAVLIFPCDFSFIFYEYSKTWQTPINPEHGYVGNGRVYPWQLKPQCMFKFSPLNHTDA